jgi:hypothetical protein
MKAVCLKCGIYGESKRYFFLHVDHLYCSNTYYLFIEIIDFCFIPSLLTYSGNAVCVQTFLPTSELSRFTPSSVISVGKESNLVAVGSKMHLFKCHRIEVVESAPIACLFNPTTKTFLTCTGQKMTVWNALDGKVNK